MAKKYCSIASNPGSFGERFHNQGYVALGLDCSYNAFKVLPEQLASFMDFARQNFAGISVSMPHKTEVIRFLDDIDPVARMIGAVNTVNINNGKFKGYNTDYDGARRVLTPLDISGKKVVLLGAGGVGKAIAYAVTSLNGDLVIVNRDSQKSEKLAEKLGAKFVPYQDLVSQEGYLFINATSIGMKDQGVPLSPDKLGNYEAIMNVVVPKNSFTDEAISRGKRVVTGLEMTAQQAAQQFKIYTSRDLPEEFVRTFSK